MNTSQQQEQKIQTRRRRLSQLIVTRSPSSYGEIPTGTIAEREVDDGKRGPVRVERGDTGEVDQPG